jgi:tetratricopeptide (TPR) repeat protein
LPRFSQNQFGWTAKCAKSLFQTPVFGLSVADGWLEFCSGTMAKRMQPAMNSASPSYVVSPQPHFARMSVRFALSGCALLIMIVAALYFPVRHHSFLNYDDDDYVVNNLHVQEGLNTRSLRWAFTNLDAAQYQPITWISHIVDCDLYGLNPSGHHGTNVILHAMNAMLLFLVLTWLTGASGRSLVVAALFAVHPVNVENVAWVAERKTLVCTFFSFVSLGAYLWYVQKRNWMRYALVLLSVALALGSKSMAVTLPAAMLVLDYWPLRRFHGNELRPWGFFLEKIPLFAMSAAISVLTLHAEEQGSAITHLSVANRFAHAAWSCVAYLGRLACPANLTVLTPYPVHGHNIAVVILSAIVLIALTSATVALRRRAPYALAGWLFYLISIAPVSGFVPVGHSVLSDRFLYTPELGIFLVVVWFFADCMERLELSTATTWLSATALLGAYASVTALYLPSWRNSYTLFARAENISPGLDPLIENNLGQGLVEIGRRGEAVPHYRAAIALAPQLPLPHYNLGNSLLLSGDAPAAAAEFQTAAEHASDARLRLRALNNLGVAQLQLGQLDRAEQSFTAALSLDSKSERSLVGRGEARARIGKFADAVPDLRSATALAPDPNAYYWLGKALAGLGARDEAVSAWQRALALSPNLRDAQQLILTMRSQSQ